MCSEPSSSRVQSIAAVMLHDALVPDVQKSSPQCHLHRLQCLQTPPHLSSAVMPSMSCAEDRDFDTTISGPWMDRWELVHHNRHVAAHLAASAAGQAAVDLCLTRHQANPLTARACRARSSGQHQHLLASMQGDLTRQLLLGLHSVVPI